MLNADQLGDMIDVVKQVFCRCRILVSHEEVTHHRQPHDARAVSALWTRVSREKLEHVHLAVRSTRGVVVDAIRPAQMVDQTQARVR